MRVYQLASGGYGPAHYLLLLDEAMPLKPKVILAPYYFGNDNIDAYQLVYTKWSGPDGSLVPLVSTDAEVRKAIARAEEIDPRVRRSLYLDCQSPRPVKDRRLQTVRDILTASPVDPLGQYPLLRRALDALPRYSAVLSRMRQAFDRLRGRQAGITDYGPPLCLPYRKGEVHTVFNVGYRLIALDTSDPRVVEGERINLAVLKLLGDRCRRIGCQLYVVMIPTKEMVFRTQSEDALRDESLIVRLWQAEARARSRLVEFLAGERIPVIDVLPALQALVIAGVNPYKEDADGHPIAPGYEAIARTVVTHLREEPVLGPIRE